MRNKLKHITFYLLLACSMTTLAQERIWVDTDIMIGQFGRDVDDGVALMTALESDKVEIIGISLVHGVDYGYKAAQRVLRWHGNENEIPLYKGAKSKEELGVENEAVKALAKALQKEKLRIIALGPLTNLGTLLKLHPELESRITEIVFCGGRRPGMHFQPGNGKITVSDFNFDLDPDAMQVLLNTDINITLVGYEPASYLLLNKNDLLALKINPRPESKWFYKKMNRWRRQWKWAIKSKEGFMPFDAATIGHVLAPEHFKYEKNIPVKIEVLANDSRHTVKTDEKPYLLVSHKFETSRTVDYCYKTLPEYKNLIIKAFRAGTKSN